MNKCNGCGANLDWTNNVLANGVWVAQCKYCGNQMPVVQRPKYNVTFVGESKNVVVGDMAHIVNSFVQVAGGDIK